MHKLIAVILLSGTLLSASLIERPTVIRFGDAIIVDSHICDGAFRIRRIDAPAIAADAIYTIRINGVANQWRTNTDFMIGTLEVCDVMLQPVLVQQFLYQPLARR